MTHPSAPHPPRPPSSPREPSLPGPPAVEPSALGLADSVRDLKPASPSEFLPSVRPWVRLAGALLVGGFAAAVGLMALWPYRVIVRGPGTVRPSGGTSLVHAPREGRVRQINIRTNQPVQQGEVLAVLDPADLEARQHKLSQVRAALESQLQTQRQEDRAALQAAELEVDRAEATLRLARSEHQRYSQLVESGATSQEQLEEKAANLSIARSGYAKARQEVEQQRFRGGSAQARLQQQLAEARAEQAQLSLDLGRTLVRAPVSGVVFSVALRNPQQVVAAGQELARIAPHDAEMLVKVRVASEDIARVEPGQRADLRLVGCPYPDFGTLRARVVSVAPDALPAAGVGVSGSASAEPDGLTSLAGPAGFEVTLRPDARELVTPSGRSCSLRQGMDLTADITTRQETVLRFLLRRTRLFVGF